ncbi:hypothetical protein KSB_23510 [Ktedonobacter robiniae]|uniref:Uncharacterized protein n=1 Tax=Ktedonobacter robiniae TaxID=2778365 RepID=A0ABQ3UM98_9CHLR|nr:hypothetical protein KSB_23510 [Ktedonobacter robiniae]
MAANGCQPALLLAYHLFYILLSHLLAFIHFYVIINKLRTHCKTKHNIDVHTVSPAYTVGHVEREEEI